MSDLITQYEARAQAAQAAAAQAYARLVGIAERSDTGQACRIAHFLASTYNGQHFPYDPFDLRTVDVEISDDMLACLDALRWGRADLFKLLPGGRARVLAVMGQWGCEYLEP